MACPLWLDELNVNHQITFDSSLEIFCRWAKMTRHSLPEQVASGRLLAALPSYFPVRISYMIRLRSLLFVLIIALSLTAVTIVFADNPPQMVNLSLRRRTGRGPRRLALASSTVSWSGVGAICGRILEGHQREKSSLKRYQDNQHPQSSTVCYHPLELLNLKCRSLKGQVRP